MASRTKRPDQVNRRDGNEAAAVVGDQLEALARQGARHMLMDALGEEVEAYLQRGRYRRREDEECFRGYRNGTSPRRLTLGSGTIDRSVPRVRDIPKPIFNSGWTGEPAGLLRNADFRAKSAPEFENVVP